MCVERDAAGGLQAGVNRRERVRASLLRLFAWLIGPIVAPASHPSPTEITRVLLIRPDHLGDFLFATPALDRWQAHAPARIETTLSVGPWCADLAAHGPCVGRVETFSYPGLTRTDKGSVWSPYRALIRLARLVRRGEFDMAVIMRFDHWWGGLLAYLAGIPICVGYDTDPLHAFLTDTVPYNGVAHEVERNLTLIDRALTLCGGDLAGTKEDFPSLVYQVDAEERREVEVMLAGLSISESAPLVVVHPGAGAPVKMWPAERFAAVADALVERWGATILLTGASGDLGQAWKVAAHMREDAHVLAGRTDLAQLGALLERGALVIGADSGPLHLAVAVGAPSIHLYGPVDPAMFGPWSDQPTRHRVLTADCPCAPCNRLVFEPVDLPAHLCMETISVEQVLRAADGMLSEIDPSR